MDIIEGALKCNACERIYPIENGNQEKRKKERNSTKTPCLLGIPNMILNDDEVK